ncbi:MAG: hypothetical protein P8019_16660 [Gammaproteobacteria bacterium]
MKLNVSILVLSVFVTSGCAPIMHHQFFKPNIPSGINGSYITKAYCYSAHDKPLRGHGSVGPPSRLVVPISKILFSVSITDETNDALNFQINFSVPQGNILQLTETKVRLFDASKNLIASFELALPYKRSGVVVHRDGAVTMSGKNFDLWFGLNGVSNFTFVAHPKKPVPDEFYVIFPKLLVNGSIFELPQIVFKRDQSIEYFVSGNC